MAHSCKIRRNISAGSRLPIPDIGGRRIRLKSPPSYRNPYAFAKGAPVNQ